MLLLAAVLVGCHAPEERPAPAPVRALDDARPVPSKGGRMQLDDSLALCLCDLTPGGCNGKYQSCWHPLESHDPEVRVQLSRNSALCSTGRPRFMPVDPSELRFLGKLDDGKPVCPSGAKGRVGHLRRGIRRAPPGLLGASRHMWDEATYETVAWCGPALGPEVLR
jgi:hypothetical protein